LEFEEAKVKLLEDLGGELTKLDSEARTGSMAEAGKSFHVRDEEGAMTAIREPEPNS
jgi:hypothetical protein